MQRALSDSGYQAECCPGKPPESSPGRPNLVGRGLFRLDRVEAATVAAPFRRGEVVQAYDPQWWRTTVTGEAPGEGARPDRPGTHRRRLVLPLWVAAVGLLAVGLLGGVVLASVFGDDEPVVTGAVDNGSTTRPDQASPVPTTTSSAPNVTSTTAEATTTAPSATRTLPEPRGTLTIVGASAGYSFGQGFPNGPCATWQLLFENNSNTEIVQVVYAPGSGQYSNFAEFNAETQQHAPDIPAEPPAPAVLDLSLPSYSQQVVNFETCTTTPEPANTNYDFSAAVPERVPFTWVTGHEGIAEFVP